MLAETEYRHQVAADIQPFRGLLLGRFFMTVGISLDLGIIFENTLLVLGLLVGLIVLKTLITMALCRISGVSMSVSLNTALVRSQAGNSGLCSSRWPVGSACWRRGRRRFCPPSSR